MILIQLGASATHGNLAAVSWEEAESFFSVSWLFLEKAFEWNFVEMYLRKNFLLHKIWQLVRDTLQKSTWLLDIIGGKISLLTFSYHNGRRQLLPSWMQFLLGVETSLLLSPGLLSFGLISNDISLRQTPSKRSNGIVGYSYGCGIAGIAHKRLQKMRLSGG